MTTLQGIISKSIQNSQVQLERLAYISTNFANYNTYGYKGVRFEQMLDENGFLKGYERTDFSQGAIQITEREFDVAIDGSGFFPVTSPNGEVSYTRDGSFRLDKDGYLITNDGHLVGDGIQIPINYDNLRIKDNGEVEVFSNDGTKREILGTIPLVNFRNPEALKKGDNNKYYITEESGEPLLIKRHNSMQQGRIEVTNVNMLDEGNNMMRINASMLASHQLITTINQMYSKALQLNQ